MQVASFAQLLEVNQSDTVRVEVIKKKKTKQNKEGLGIILWKTKYWNLGLNVRAVPELKHCWNKNNQLNVNV